MYSDRTGTDKNHPDKTFQTKDPWQTPGQKPQWTIETEFVQGGFCLVFCTRPSKIGGGVWDVWHTFEGVPGCVTKCDRGRGLKLAKNIVTYFMDSPLSVFTFPPNLGLPLQYVLGLEVYASARKPPKYTHDSKTTLNIRSTTVGG